MPPVVGAAAHWFRLPLALDYCDEVCLRAPVCVQLALLLTAFTSLPPSPPCAQLALLLWLVARCRIPLSDDSRDVMAEAVYNCLPDAPAHALFSLASALAALGPGFGPGLLSRVSRRALRVAQSPGSVGKERTSAEGLDRSQAAAIKNMPRLRPKRPLRRLKLSSSQLGELGLGVTSLLVAAVNSPR